MSDLRVVREFRDELTGAPPPRRRPATRRAAAAAVALVVLGVGIATAATGEFPPVGDPLPAPRHDNARRPLSPVTGTGRVAPIRTADPEGGPPWSVRTFRTRGGAECEQVGRVVKGRLGVIGDDGEFHEAPLASVACFSRRRRAAPADATLLRTHGSPNQGPGIPATGTPPREYAPVPCEDGVSAGQSFDPHTVVCGDRPRRFIDTGTVGPNVVAIEVRGGGVQERHPVVAGRYMIVREAVQPPRSVAYAVFRDGRRVRVWKAPRKRTTPVQRDAGVIRRTGLHASPAHVGRDTLVTVSMRARFYPKSRYGGWFDIDLTGPRGCPRQGRVRFTVFLDRMARAGERLRFGVRPPGLTHTERADWCSGRYTGRVLFRSRIDLGTFSFERP
ncbi:MAG TPA: hypothetical protein VF517_10980 [Thermoleophilaceae bacterium]|jgi:hypothetical protein